MTQELRDQVGKDRQAFSEMTEQLRPRLHRFCSRMCGSVLDGEDLVQDSLAHAFYRLSTLENDRALESWIFRIAHNRCIATLAPAMSEDLHDVPLAELASSSDPYPACGLLRERGAHRPF